MKVVVQTTRKHRRSRTYAIAIYATLNTKALFGEQARDEGLTESALGSKLITAYLRRKGTKIALK
jgi:hypothetical protein